MRIVPLWVFGIGGVGQALLDALSDPVVRASIRQRAGMDFRLVFLADSVSYTCDAAGLDDSVLERALAAKRDGQSLAEGGVGTASPSSRDMFSALRGAMSIQGTIGVDTTASDDMVLLWQSALGAGAGLVLANKKPLTGEYTAFQSLTRARRCRHEATVGAGLPIIATLHGLLDSGDTITSIQGCFSGTLGYICSALNRGAPYSTAVLEAVAAGYAEPDPRDDLCGLDVARKALILSRMVGRSLSLTDLRVQPMIPKMLDSLSLDEFMCRLPEADTEMAARVQQAGGQGKVLSYVADLSSEAPVIGLREIDRHSPIGSLTGTDNIAVFRTVRYCETPLVIQGPGAGREVTAAGVLTDIIALAREEM